MTVYTYPCGCVSDDTHFCSTHKSSHAEKTTKRLTDKQLVANHRRMVDPPECEHGHFGCSCTLKEKGPCLDEVLSRIELSETQNTRKSD